MRLEHRGEYPTNWPDVALVVKRSAGWRCVRCQHRFHDMEKRDLDCDPICLSTGRCRHRIIVHREGAHNFTVHHLDGNKSNVVWWNLLALCNSCHLTIQAKLIPERPYLWEHSEWFKIYAAGFYASFYGKIEITRAQAAADTAHYLALGQPWLHESTTTAGES